MLRGMKTKAIAIMMLTLFLVGCIGVSSAFAEQRTSPHKPNGAVKLPLRDYRAMTDDEKAYFTEGTETLKRGKVIMNTPENKLRITININHATPGRTTYDVWLCILDGSAYRIAEGALTTSRAGSGATRITIELPYNEFSEGTENVYIALNNPEGTTQFIAGPFTIP